MGGGGGGGRGGWALDEVWGPPPWVLNQPPATLAVNHFNELVITR